MKLSIRAFVVAAWLPVAVALTPPVARAQSMTLTPEQQSLHDIYKELIETNTEDSAGVGSVTKAAEQIAARFRAAGYPASDVHLLGPTDDKHSIVVRLHGSGAKKPLLLIAHLDVVMALPTDWTTDPFKLVEKDGFFYARGAIDDKAMASIFVANMLRYKKEGFVPDRDIILALTPDEEKSGHLGADWLVQNHKELIDAEYALNEGGGGSLDRNGKPFLHAVQATEKAFTDFTLTVKNRGGHSSVPRPDNAIYQLAEGLVRFEHFSFPVQLNDVTRAFFTGTAAIESPANAAAMRAILRNPGDAAAAAQLSKDPRYNSTLRTTCVATRLSGGDADNALPQTATALVNCRVFPNVPIDSVRATIVKVLNDTGIVVSAAEQLQPTSPSPLTAELLDPVKTLTARMFNNVPVIPFMSTGATDGRYLRAAGIPTYGVSGLFTDPGDSRIHGRDERVLQKSLYDSQEFLYQLVKMLSTEKPKV